MSVATLDVRTRGQGLYAMTDQLAPLIRANTVNDGLCTLFVQHTSASLLIQENYDPSAQADLENWLSRLVPQHDSLYTHTLEGPDDMPAHIKAALTPTSVSIPIIQGKLALGTWQGVYLWEHRDAAQQRTVVMHISH